MNEEVRTFYENPWVKWGVILSIIFLAAFLGIKTLSLLKEYRYIGGGVPVTNVVTVSGEGEVFAVPDRATFTFSVVEEAKTVEEAQTAATEKINALIDYLEDADVEEGDIRTVSYNVYPRYEFRRENAQSTIGFPEGSRELVGFEVRQSIEVKVEDTEKAGELLSGVGARGASDISGLQFTIDDEDALLAEARKAAIDDAQQKAEQLARDLDVRLIRVVSFHESGGDFPFAARSFRAGFGGAVDATVLESAPQVPTGENRIISNVSITYEIR